MRQLASGQVSGASGAKRDENLHRLSTVQRIVAVAHQGAKQRLPWRTGRRLSFGLDGENLWFGEDRFAVRAPGESYPAVVHAVVASKLIQLIASCSPSRSGWFDTARVDIIPALIRHTCGTAITQRRTPISPACAAARRSNDAAASSSRR